MEEFVKYTILMRPHFGLFADRYSERAERAGKEQEAEEQKLKMVADTKGVVNGVTYNTTIEIGLRN